MLYLLLPLAPLICGRLGTGGGLPPRFGRLVEDPPFEGNDVGGVFEEVFE